MTDYQARSKKAYKQGAEREEKITGRPPTGDTIDVKEKAEEIKTCDSIVPAQDSPNKSGRFVLAAIQHETLLKLDGVYTFSVWDKDEEIIRQSVKAKFLDKKMKITEKFNSSKVKQVTLTWRTVMQEILK